MNSGEVWRLGHRPGLDGLRGVAILLVLAEHGGLPIITAAGAVGVTLFFVLSGFLITSLLVEERDRTGHIDLSAFYLRRVRRLGPALATMTLAVAIIGLTVGPSWFFSWPDLAVVVLYVGNWSRAAGNDLGAFSGTWSLAVEEQFYLLWPVFLIGLMRFAPRRLLVWTLSLAVASLALRWIYVAGGMDPGAVYARTDTSALGLLLGASLAIWLHRRQGAEPAPLSAWAGVLVGCLLVVSTTGWPLKASVLPAVVAMVAVPLVMVATTNAPGWLTGRWLVWFGQRSYAMYLWHIPLTRVLRDYTDLPWPARAVLIFGWAAIASEASWRLLESRFVSRSGGAEVDRRHRRRRHVEGCGARLSGEELDVLTGRQEQIA